MIYNSGIRKWNHDFSAACEGSLLFVLFVCASFPGGEEGALFIMIFISLNMFVYLLFSPRY